MSPRKSTESRDFGFNRIAVGRMQAGIKEINKSYDPSCIYNMDWTSFDPERLDRMVRV